MDSKFPAFNKGKLGVIYCSSGKYFAEGVVRELKKIINVFSDESAVVRKCKQTVFMNSEIKTELLECIRNQDIYIFQDVENRSGGLNVNDNYMELKTAIDAVKRSNAQSITVVLPAFPYARQDKTKSREGITASMVAREIEDAGANRVLTLDIHNDAIAGFFRNANLEVLRASKALIEYVNLNIGTDNLIVVSPDSGGAHRANYFAKKLKTKLAIIYKERDYSNPNEVESMSLAGNVKGKNVFLVDDMIDTAGTLVEGVKLLKEKGANKVYFGTSLAIFSGSAVERLDAAFKQGLINKVIGTSVVHKPKDFKEKHPWYDEVALEQYFAKVIYNINKGLSISKLIE